MFDYQAHGLIASQSRLPLPGNGPQHIAEILDHIVAKHPQRDALVGRSSRYSYAELDEVVNRACCVFLNLGIKRYDRIAACLPNDVDIVIAFLASARIGAIWVGVNRPLAGPEKSYLLNDSGAKVYLADAAMVDEMVDEISKEKSNLEDLQTIVCVGKEQSSEAQHDWHQLLNDFENHSVDRVEVDAFEPVAIAYTSGTTGFPKGAVHSHHNVMLPGAIAVANQSYGADCVQGVMLPLTILNLIVLAPMVAFQDGSCCVCMDGLKPDFIAQWVKQESVGHFASVPTVIQDLLTSPDVNPDDLKTLGHPDIGGAGIAEEVQQLYKERFGRGMIVAYGMTEAPTIVTRSDPNKVPEPELCGKAVEQLEVLIVDETNQELAVGEIGEVCVKPAESGRFAGIYTTMLGYWNRQEASEEALKGGFYHSGDLGFLTEDGNLFIRGRQKELIIRGGANIYPAEVERIMMMHPAVATAAVLGINDERLGQRVVAAIEVSTNDTTDTILAEVDSYCREQLARYKVPEVIKIVQTLPRNAMNKVIKPKLLDLFN